jgi:hypothetical protein
VQLQFFTKVGFASAAQEHRPQTASENVQKSRHVAPFVDCHREKTPPRAKGSQPHRRDYRKSLDLGIVRAAGRRAADLFGARPGHFASGLPDGGP